MLHQQSVRAKYNLVICMGLLNSESPKNHRNIIRSVRDSNPGLSRERAESLASRLTEQ